MTTKVKTRVEKFLMFSNISKNNNLVNNVTKEYSEARLKCIITFSHCLKDGKYLACHSEIFVFNKSVRRSNQY